MTPLLQLSGVHAGYDGVDVLRGVDLSVQAGELLTVLGRNGAGKTTLLHAIFNLGPRVSGAIQYRGQPVTGLPTHRIARLGIGLVPQGRGVFGPLTVHDSLALATLAPRRPGSSVPARWTLARVYDVFERLHDKRRCPSGALSGGERQMLALARALLTQPDVLALDEPSEGLSPQAVETLLVTHLPRLIGEGLTIVLVEQNLSLSLRLASRVVILDHGRIGFEGSPSQLQADVALQHRLLGV